MKLLAQELFDMLDTGGDGRLSAEVTPASRVAMRKPIPNYYRNDQKHAAGANGVNMT